MSLWILYALVCFAESASVDASPLSPSESSGKLLLHIENTSWRTSERSCPRLWGEDACCAFVSSPRHSAKVSWKGHFYLVRNKNPFREDSLPFRNLYTRNPIGLTHCAVESLINPYSVQRMHLINGFGPLSCLITRSRPSIMTAGSELEAITNPAKHTACEPCVHVHICNYVHIWKALARALAQACVNELLWK